MSIDGAYALIFGGCCSNVFALEAIIQHEPNSGLLITTIQLLLVTLFTLPTQLERRRAPSTEQDASAHTSSLLPYSIRRPRIPLPRLAMAAALFGAVNILNNWAFAFEISVPMHIILRSFGSVTTLVVGYCVGKRYSTVQVWSIIGLTFGVVLAAWADASAKGKDLSLTSTAAESHMSSFYAGVAVLFVAQLLGAIQGVFTEQTYAAHGRHWKETLFYTHFLGTFFSLAFLPTLVTQLETLALGPKLNLHPSIAVLLDEKRLPEWTQPHFNSASSALDHMFPRKLNMAEYMPSQPLALLLLNAMTQYVCITGVNKLSATTTAVTVTVVLNVRKLVSFLLSCVLFGNVLNPMMATAAGVVFVSGATYGLGGAMKKKGIKAEEQKEKREVTEPETTMAQAEEAVVGEMEKKTTSGAKKTNGAAREMNGSLPTGFSRDSITSSAVWNADVTLSRR